MATNMEEIYKALSSMIFIGKVTTVNEADATAVVTVEDHDDKTTSALSVLQRGSNESKDYWVPDIDDQVLCIRLPNKSGRGFNSGFIVGAFYSDIHSIPAGANSNTRVLDTPGNLLLKIGGNLTIKAGTIDIAGGGDVVVGGISLVNHTHSGVIPGGGQTGKPT